MCYLSHEESGIKLILRRIRESNYVIYPHVGYVSPVKLVHVEILKRVCIRSDTLWRTNNLG